MCGCNYRRSGGGAVNAASDLSDIRPGGGVRTAGTGTVQYMRGTVQYMRGTVQYMRGIVQYMRGTVQYMRALYSYLDLRIIIKSSYVLYCTVPVALIDIRPGGGANR